MLGPEVEKIDEHIVKLNEYVDRELAGRGGRTCLVTVGATASFRALLLEVSTPQFLRMLQQNGYSEIRVQTGWEDWEWFTEHIRQLAPEDMHGMVMEAFPITDKMKDQILSTRGKVEGRLAGCVIGHCGSGTVLDAQRFGAALVAVPNPALAGNHQQELANELEALGFGLVAQLGHIHEVVPLVHDKLVLRGRLNHLAPYEEPPFPVPDGERCTLFDWMALTS